MKNPIQRNSLGDRGRPTKPESADAELGGARSSCGQIGARHGSIPAAACFPPGRLPKTRGRINEPVRPSFPKSRNKFGAVKVSLDGITFDSKAEAKRYGELKLLEKARKISDLRIHRPFDISIRGYLIATYRPDFTYMDKDGRFHCEDVKSAPTAAKRDFVLIRKLMRAVNGVEIELVGVKSRTA